jgi:D-aminopeptidase
VKQVIKNKCKNGYKSGWLEVPTKFAYLEGNSAKKDPSASRKRRTVAPKKAGAKKAAKKAAKKSQAASTSSKVATGKGKAKATAPSKPKRKVVVESDEDEDMESDVAEESEEGSDV